MKQILIALVLLCVLACRAYSQPADGLTFYHHLPQIEAFNEPLMVGMSRGFSGLPVKICADGSVATLIVYKPTAPLNSTVGFRISERAAFNDDTSRIGSFGAPFVLGDKTFRVYYQHPASINEKVKVRRLTVEAFDQLSDQVLESYPMDVYNPPVVLLHDVFGNAANLRTISDSIAVGLYPDTLIAGYPESSGFGSRLVFPCDYNPTADKGFTENRYTARNAINMALMRCRQNGFSAGAVRLVGFGYGGLLARLWLQDAEYQNTIQTLITVNTPHAGSHMAALARKYPAVVATLGLQGFNMGNGAIACMDPNTDSLDLMLNGPSLNRNIVSTFVVASSYSGADYTSSSWLSGALVLVSGSIYATRVQDSIDLLNTQLSPAERARIQARHDTLAAIQTPATLKSWIFDTHQNDMSAVQSSQRGGSFRWNELFGPNGYTAVQAGDNENVKARLVRKLWYDPKSSIEYSRLGFAPVKPDLNALNALPALGGNAVPGTVFTAAITAPARGASVPSGTVLPVTIKGSTGVSAMCLVGAVADDPAGSFNDFTTDKNHTFNVAVPAGSFGPMRFTLRAYFPDSVSRQARWIPVDTVTVFVGPQGVAPDSVSVATPHLITLKNHRIRPQLILHYPSGQKRVVSSAAAQAVALDRRAIVDSVGPGLLLARDTGQAHARYTYAGKEAGMEVTVLKAEAFQTPVTVSVHNPPAHQINRLTMRQTLSDGNVVVTVSGCPSGRYHIQLIDRMGLSHAVSTAESTAGQVTLVIPITDVTSGVYFCRVSGSGIMCTEPVMIVK